MITGTEVVYPTLEQTGNPEAWNTYYGLTLRQLALKDFMCAMVTAINSNVAANEAYIRGAKKVYNKDLTVAEAIAADADSLVTAYINQLNKQL